MDSPRIRRALISVSDKSGLQEFAAALIAADVEIYSTGGTRRHLEEAGLEVRDISAYTGFPEMMDGRLKTLHPRVFGGILARHSRADDMAGLAEQDIVTFELVVVNLYPFEETIARAGVTDQEAIEQIDIGGPSLVRAAAKNHDFVSIATNPQQYAMLAEQVAATGSTTKETRRQLATDAFAQTAAYDRAIADYFAKSPAVPSATEEEAASLPQQIDITWQRQSSLRYGENPHQQAAVYRDTAHAGPSLLTAKQLNGKELSYNNYLDLDAAWAIVQGISQPCVSVIKHNNPCGVASAKSLGKAAAAAMAGDPVSAFGSILGCNRTLDEATASMLSEPGLFIEAIVAPRFSEEAIKILTTKPKWKNNVRLMELGEAPQSAGRSMLRQIDGGGLVQDADTQPVNTGEWTVATKSQPSEGLLEDLQFAWQVVRHVKSNAIVLAKNRSLVGAGAGQMSRVDSVEIAIRKAADRCRGSVLASDAFFPFPDSIHQAAEAGVAAIIQPGGSKNDPAVIAACDEHVIPMVLTGRRHFKH